MIVLFCKTRGYSNDFLSWFIANVKKKYHFENTGGLLGEFKENDIKNISSEIKEKGYYVFEQKLSSGLCEKLLHFALTEEFSVRPLDNQERVSASPYLITLYDRSNPKGVRYDFDPQRIINNNDVQELFCDASILSIAQAYLGCKPVLDVTSMWWHTSYLKTPDKEAAQFYHFDMDRIKWIKFFVYLTDVNEKSGPHCFVAKSHRRNGIPPELLKYGYARLTDDEVEKYYPKERFIEFIAPKGTIIAEDTRGLHKGKMVEAGDRLILQIQFSNSLFGATYKKNVFNDVKNEKLLSFMMKYKRLYSNYTA
ncbi:MAG: phytanoyl-CoA dioxygenase family protein [Nitrospiria bacterium]